MTFKLNEEFVLKTLQSTFPEGGSLNNDAAILNITNENVVVCSDNLIEGLHYQTSDSPEVVANLLLKRVVSDQAASGGVPYAISLSFMLSQGMSTPYLNSFVIQLSQRCQEFGIQLLGGDTSIVRSETSAFNITCFGKCQRFLRRDMAVDGQLIYMTGYAGDTFLANELKAKHLTTSSTKIRNYFKQVQNHDTHRTQIMQKLSEYIECVIDISDGLLLDAHRIGESSDCILNIYDSDIPLSPFAHELLGDLSASKRDSIRTKILSWGEDYEVLFTAYPSTEAEIEDICNECSIPITAVGYVGRAHSNTERFVCLLDADEENITPSKLGFQHGVGTAA